MWKFEIHAVEYAGDTDIELWRGVYEGPWIEDEFDVWKTGVRLREVVDPTANIENPIPDDETIKAILDEARRLDDERRTD